MTSSSGEDMMPSEEVASRPVVEFDQHSAEFAARFAEISSELRERCPVAFTRAHDGYWVASSYEAVVTAARDSVTFSSWKDLPVGSGRLGPLIPAKSSDPNRDLAEMDGPEHRAVRKPLTPFFSPAAVAKLKPGILTMATWVIDQIIERGSADFVTELAGPVPAIAAMWMIGLPTADWRQFWEGSNNNYNPHPDPEAMAETHSWMYGRLHDEAVQRREQPAGDLISFVANMKVNGSLMSLEEVIAQLHILVDGGVGTTAHLLANALMHLNEDRNARQWLREDLSRLPLAMEEYLRYFGPVPGLARTVTQRCELAGQTLEKNDRIWLGWMAANRDPKVFDDPETIKLDRFPNRHTSFSVGAHRCLGSNVARAVWATVMEQVLTRLPDYQIDTGRSKRYDTIGYFNGWNSLPATFSPGPRLGAELPA